MDAVRRLASTAIALVIVFQAAASASPVQAVPPPSGSDLESSPDAIPLLEEDGGAAVTEPTEVISLRTATSKTYDNHDGTLSAQIAPVPIHYQATGETAWRPIDLDFEAGLLGLTATSSRAPVQVDVAAADVAGGFMTVSRDDVRISLGLPANRLAEAVGVPDLDGPLADVGHLGDIDLHVLARPSGGKLFVVVGEEPASPDFELILRTPNLDPTLAEDGSIGIADAKGETVAHIAAPLAVDSSVDADRGGGEMTDQVAFELKRIGDGVHRLTLRVDADWLAEATYPVFVDPSITISTGSDAYGDAFVSSEYPSMNFADYQRPDSPYYHEHWLGMDPTNSAQVNYVYLRFDTSAVASKTVTLARLKVRPYHQYYNAPTATTTWVDRVTASWTESGLTWNNKPASTNITSAGTVEGSDANFTVTSTVQSWASGSLTNYGFKLHENGNNGTYWKRLIASEQGSGYSLPTLYVEYHTPTASVVSPTGSAWTRSRSLDWSFSDSSGHAQSHYEVQVSTSSGFGTLTANSGQVASSATVWSIPTSVSLTNGTTYYWRVRVKDGTSWSAWTGAAAFRWDAADATYTPPAGDIVGGAITAANPNYYDLGNGTMTVKIRGTDTHSGIKLTYLRLYNATDELRVSHDWSIGGTHCNEFNVSSLADATACSESYSSGGVREVTFTIVGLSTDATFSVRWHFVDYAGNAVGYDEPNAAPNDGLTGKNLVFDHTAPTGAITNPAAGATVGGSVTISGTASDANFHQYWLDYGAGTSPTTWSAIGTNPRTTAVSNGTLGTWNTGALANGVYTLRLRVYDKARVSSGFKTVTRTVTVDNAVPTAIISAPAANAYLIGNVTVTGTASASSGFASYTLDYGAGCAPSSWTVINTSTSQVTNGTLGTWNTSSLTGQYALRLTVTKTGGLSNTAVVCVNPDNTAPSAIIGSPAVNDFVNGTVDIVGQATDPNFTGYDLHVGAGTNPPSWTAVGSNPRTVAVEDGVLGSWDTAGLSGTYTIRLRVYDQTHTTSGFAEATRTVTVSDAVNLSIPSVLHATGAELRWSLYDGTAPSSGYEIHRSASASFTPSAATLIARLGDPGRIAWLDTSAKPATAFSYRIVANGLASNEVRVTLPAAGQASVTLQPGPADGSVTGIHAGANGCRNYGAQPSSVIGSGTAGAYRALFAFDLRAIAAGATISSATFSYAYQPTSASVGTVNLHQLLGGWREGSGTGECDGTGASWKDTDVAAPWDAAGADFASAVSASVNPASRASGGTDAYTITSLVQRWIDAGSPNHGFVIKAASEPSTNGNSFAFATDDYGLDPAKRPKLVITYAEPGAAQAPHVAVNQPSAGATVRGTITLGATASDDSGVASVDFLVGGAVVGSDAAAPFAISWNSTGVANGARAITARATDNAGNVRTSDAITVSVDNVTPPTVALTAPTGGTVSGNVTLSANASGTGLVRVEFLYDDYLIGSDTTSPYSLAWNTLDPLLSAYDGSHALVARVYDAGGQMTQSVAVNVTVANRTGKRLATFELASDSEVPAFVFEDVAAGARTEALPSARTLDGSPISSEPGAAYRASTCTPSGSLTANDMPGTEVKVVVTNASPSQWGNGEYDLWYRWFTPDGQVIFEGRLAQGFQTTNPGASRTISGDVFAPALCGADQLTQLRLRFDLLDPASGVWFGEQGNAPFDHPVAVGKELQVAKSLSDALGLERYYQYWGTDVGAGMGHLVNVANGNSLLRWTPFSGPGRGLSTVVDLTYNSLEDHSDSPVGNNWSLAVSSLSRLGGRLDIHPNKADTLANNSTKWIAFTDGDGTTHRFDGKVAADGTIYWEAPPGVHLFLRDYATARNLSGTLATERKWALTRPDGVSFYYNVDGFPTRVDDRNGNALTFSLEAIPPADDPGGDKFRVTAVTDAGGRSFEIDYYDRAEAPKPQVRGKVQTIGDHTGSVLAFEYYLDGNLRRIIQRGGIHADGSALADRSFVLSYTTPNGSGPAIADPEDRYAADPGTNQSTRLHSVFDPRGAETTFSYFGPGSGELRWKLSGVTNRAGAQTAFTYDLANRVTTVTAPLTRVTRYAYDTDGKVTSITDPLNRATAVSWTADFSVSAVDELGAGRTEYSYNANGYLTDRKVKTGVDGSGDPVFAHTRLEYQNLEADPQPAGWDETGKWKPGRTIPHLSQLLTKIDPNGMSGGTPTGSHRWGFAYDARGNLLTLTDPEDNDTTFTYSASDGTLLTATDALGRRTDYSAYDANGFATVIAEGIAGGAAALGSTRLTYDADGRLTAVQDPNHFALGPTMTRDNSTFFEYDAFGRLGRQSAPKSTALEPGVLIWSSALYDANDNLERQVGPHYGRGYTGLGAATETTFDAMDRQTLVVGPDTSVDPAGERTALAYDAAGRLTSVTAPKGVLTGGVANDFATLYAYDPLDRIVRVTRDETDGAQRTLVSHACYDGNDDLVRVTMPNAALSTVDCGAAAPSHTWRYEYDAAHRQTAVIDPEGHRSETAYDATGNVTATVDALDAATTVSYDQRNLPVQVSQPFLPAAGGDPAHPAVTRIEYDAVGNRSRLISPRAVDADAGAGTYDEYATAFVYDALNRLVRTDLPTSNAFPAAQYVHAAYDPNGNLTWSSLPMADATPPSTAAGRADTGTVLTLWDPGWIATSASPDTTPEVHFDYSAEGWQAMRAPERASGELNTAEQMFWSYFADGQLRERRDRGGQRTTYTYDANNNLTRAVDAAGLTAAQRTPVEVLTDYTSLGQILKTRQREVAAPGASAEPGYTFTRFAYDRNSNVTTRIDNGAQAFGSSTETGGRTQEYTYDDADWVTTQLDRGSNSTAGAWSDDQRITNTFTATGQEATRLVERATSASAWATAQTTAWEYFANRKLAELTITDDAGATVEHHAVEYLDADGVYVNGHRTADSQMLLGPNTAAPCRSLPGCRQTYEYDPRDRLVAYDDGQPAGTDTTYQLDLVGNINSQTDTTGGVAATTDYDYLGNQLQSVTSPAGVVQRYHYDPTGNLACVTLAAGDAGDCGLATGGIASTNLLARYSYDYVDRLVSYRSFTTNGVTSTADDVADYEHDALDRVNNQVESHEGGTSRLTQFSHLGLSGRVSGESQFAGSSPTPSQALTNKSYGYDAWGNRISLIDDATDLGAPGTGDPAAKPYTYAYDVHGSVSLLLDATGASTASYGYRPYGAADDALTAGDFDPSDPDEDANREDNPLNAFRYTGRRLDSGSGSIDMGARRYGPDTSRFLQRDYFNAALGDLGLATNPLTQGRYSMAGGNPVSFVEWDGHVFYVNGDGGGVRLPSTREPDSSTDSGDSADQTTSQDDEFVPAALAWTFSGLAAPAEAFTAFRWWTSTLGRTLRTAEDAARRSAAARLLPLAGRFTSTGVAVALRRAAAAVPALGGLVSFGSNLLDGQEWEEAGFKATTETTAGLATAGALGLATCGAAAVATFGIGGAVCAAAVIGGGVLGATAGDVLGNWLYEQEPVRSAVQGFGDVAEGVVNTAGDVLDTITFWDNGG